MDKGWKEICEKCRDGDMLPEGEYFGEPNGCNSPTYGKHPKAAPIGNAAAMHEALEKIRDLACIVKDSNGESDGGVRTSLPADWVVDTANAALSAPPRNCDRFKSMDEAEAAYLQTHRRIIVRVFIEWLFASAEEGGEK